MSPDKVEAACVVSLTKIVQDVAALHLDIFIHLSIGQKLSDFTSVLRMHIVYFHALS